MDYADRGLSAHLLGLEYHFGSKRPVFAGLFDAVNASNSFRERQIMEYQPGSE